MLLERHNLSYVNSLQRTNTTRPHGPPSILCEFMTAGMNRSSSALFLLNRLGHRHESRYGDRIEIPHGLAHRGVSSQAHNSTQAYVLAGRKAMCQNAPLRRIRPAAEFHPTCPRPLLFSHRRWHQSCARAPWNR